jgi:1-pyrroline-5-carboxylate dehydrogenase
VTCAQGARRARADRPERPTATVDPEGLNATNMGFVENLVAGRWEGASGKKQRQILDPLNGEVCRPSLLPQPRASALRSSGTALNGGRPRAQPFIQVAEVTKEGIAPYVERLRASPKYGRHNPIHNVTRYLMLGEVSKKAAAALGDPSVERFFTRLIQRVSPKSIAQAKGEVVVTRKFLENFSGDQVPHSPGSAAPASHTSPRCLTVVVPIVFRRGRCR